MDYNLITQRQQEIYDFIANANVTTIQEISDALKFSPSTIRRDLKVLENAGCLKRTYGGAILSQDYPLERDVVDRRNVNVEKKAAIAEKALGLIRDNETIFLDISTTNIKLAELLVEKHRRVVVVSNMIDILQVLAKSPLITAVGTGGIMYQTVNGFMGAAAMEMIRQYSFDRAFVGTCGLDLTDASITTLGVEDGLTKRAALQSSRHKYIVMEKDKFYFNDSYKFAHFDDIDGIISDETPDPATVSMLENAGVILY